MKNKWFLLILYLVIILVYEEFVGFNKWYLNIIVFIVNLLAVFFFINKFNSDKNIND